MARFIGSRSRAGLTLVELVIAMLILSVIAGIGAQSFLIVLRGEQEMDAGVAAIRGQQLILAELRQEAANLIPAEVSGCQPYEEGVNPAHGTPVYRMLTRLPERFAREEHLGQTQALLVEFSLEQNAENELRLVYSKQAVGSSGRIGDPIKGVLAEHVTQFSITPELESDSSEESAGEAGDSGGVRVPKGLNVTLAFKGSDESVSTATFIPIRVKADKQEKQDKDSKADPAESPKESGPDSSQVDEGKAADGI